MKSIIHTLLFFLYILVVPSETYAQTNTGRPFSPRELQPYGQMRDEIYDKTATFRLIRTQEERRPRDARALGPQDLGAPGIARPELLNTIRQNRKKNYGGGWVWQDMGEQADQSDGWTPLLEEPGDYNLPRQNTELTATEWWEQKFRGQGQRGGWFRARFGSSGGTQIRAGDGSGASSQPQQQQAPGGMGGSMGSSGMGGGGGAGGMGGGM